ncbi:MAG: hypothetical protein GY798_05430 [Hyphomicrobiales bacterium]|nr:hypothetical protein [Hyphomicrobiales bacterium]
MAVTEIGRFKIVPETIKSDKTLWEDRGWIKIDVRWLVTEARRAAVAKGQATLVYRRFHWRWAT